MQLKRESVCVCKWGEGGEAKSLLRAEPQNSRYTRNSELVLVAELCACAAFCLPLYGTVNLVRLPAHALPLCWPKARVMFL